ncbi:MAG: hypothetical protein FRX48_08997 [Lasallia pustulata]|uniref:Multiple myeloma tumor-associated protein 2-like N-terminal domain-containing protein n=1 Tax=Lasallia pustulata TaxID=136370 RepID=A0A5M8PD91_9LECA|nr:MAG: hypothetical protein FRX48_08997 [Lasallia pustulata]
MDLVASIRKEGSRGGRASFKWSDVKEDQHRENYLGHSLMAPVGRWQKNRDLGWYAQGSSSAPAAESAAAMRAEEIRVVKEAEREALGRALGFAPVEGRGGDGDGDGNGGGEVERVEARRDEEGRGDAERKLGMRRRRSGEERERERGLRRRWGEAGGGAQEI